MRNSGVLVKGLAIFIIASAWCANAQDGFELLNPKPTRGSFYSLQKFLNGIVLPPLPYNPLPDADLYACVSCDGHRNWLYYDDRNVDYRALAQSQMGQLSESESDDSNGEWQPAYDYPSNSFFLEITGLSSNRDTAILLLHGTQAGEVYELKSTVLLTNHVLTAHPDVSIPAHCLVTHFSRNRGQPDRSPGTFQQNGRSTVARRTT